MYRDREIHPRVKDMLLPRLSKPRRGLQIFDTRVDFPVPVQSGGRLIESTTTLYRDREIHPSVKDLQSTTRLAESWKLHIFDTRVDFPVPVQSGC